jgi:hypothetical protein
MNEKPRSPMVMTSRFLRKPAPAGSRNRSRAGLVVSLLSMPLLLGVMACFVLPVPVGDPERSRVDASLSGVWMGIAEEDDEPAILVLEPYDKRTWLVSWIFLGPAVEQQDEVPAASGQGSAAAAEGDTGTETAAASDDEEPVVDESGEEKDWPAVFSRVEQLLTHDELKVESVMPFKGWLTKIKGERFMTWEPKMVLWSDEALTPPHWWVLRLRVLDKDHLTLDYIDPDFEDLEHVKTTSDAEAILRRNIDNGDLYVEDGTVHYLRVPHEDYQSIHEILSHAGVSSNFEDL